MTNYLQKKKTFDSASKKRPDLINWAQQNIRPAAKPGKSKTWFLLLSFLLSISVSFIQPTLAYFTDSAESNVSELSSGTLSFTVGDYKLLDISSKSASGQATVKNTGTLGFKYNVQTVVPSGEEICSKATFTSEINGDETSGPLLGFVSSDVVFSSPDDVWTFTVSVDKKAPKGQIKKYCAFGLLFSAWQENMSQGEGGFTYEVYVPGLIGQNKKDHTEGLENDDSNFLSDQNESQEQRAVVSEISKPDEQTINEDVTAESLMQPGIKNQLESSDTIEPVADSEITETVRDEKIDTPTDITTAE